MLCLRLARLPQMGASGVVALVTLGADDRMYCR